MTLREFIADLMVEGEEQNLMDKELRFASYPGSLGAEYASIYGDEKICRIDVVEEDQE